MQLIVKRFDELTVDELYEILKLRSKVFVLEQNCAYQDVDGIDPIALHIFLRDETGLQACLRVFPNGKSGEAAIGRVIAAQRRKGLGTMVLREGIRAAAEFLGANEIRIEAQTYAHAFYERQGFVQTSEEFLEDGIPHIEMRLKLE